MNRPRQRGWAIALAVLAVLLLAFPSALAVYEWLKPIRGEWAARSAAVGIELTYLALACLLFVTKDQQSQARRLQLWAVFTAVLINSIDSYSKRGVNLSSGVLAWSTFDPFLLGLSVVESIPLAGLAFGVSMILHRLIADDLSLGVSQPKRLNLAKRAYIWLSTVAEGLARRPRNDSQAFRNPEPDVISDDEFLAPWELPETFDTIDPEPDVDNSVPWPGLDPIINNDYQKPKPVIFEGLAETLQALRSTTEPAEKRRIRRILREKHNYRLREGESEPPVA